MGAWIMAVLGLALVPPLIVRFFRRGGKAAPAKPDTIRITVTDTALIVEDLKSAVSVRGEWAVLRKIAVIRTDLGPFPDDLFYHIAFDGGDVTVPSQAHNMRRFYRT